MACFEEAVEYAQHRVMFDKVIAGFQIQQERLADMLTEIEHAKLMVLKAAWEKDNGRGFELTASLAKLYSGEVSRKVVNEAVQIHGGYGFMDEYPVSRMYRDQKINEIGEGTNIGVGGSIATILLVISLGPIVIYLAQTFKKENR